MKKKLLLFISPLLLKVGFAQNNPNTIITQFNSGTTFSCIAVDTSHRIWAGTNKKGLFVFNKYGNQYSGNFELVSSFPADGSQSDVKDFVIQSLAADKLGNLWVGHSGLGTTMSNMGGMDLFSTNSLSHVKHLSPDRNTDCFSLIERDGIATLNVQSIAVDEYNTVWTAHKYHDLTSGADYILTPGSLSYKRINQAYFTTKSTWQDLKDDKEAPELPFPAFTCKVPISKSPGSRTCNAVACGKSEVWVSVYPYEYATSRGINLNPFSLRYPLTTDFLPARILVYDLNGGFKKQITFETVGATAGGVFNAICITKSENVWIGLSASKGFAARINGCWTLLNATTLPGVFLTGANVNQNAIWSNKKGQVFIGTTKGLIVFNGVGKVDDPSSYSLYTTTTSNISSNNILGGANDRDTVQWVATDNGINRIKSSVNFSSEPDYTSCNHPHINAIEKQLKTDLFDREDWHSYIVETTICDKKDKNDPKCNAQAVFNFMKTDVAYQAVSPQMFSYDNLKLSLLKGLTDDEKKEILANVNAWKENRLIGNEFGGIKDIRQVLSPAMIDKYYCSSLPSGNCFGNGQLPFMESIDKLQRKFQQDFQNDKNVNDDGSKTIVSCTKDYYLYNSFNMVVDRFFYGIPDFLFCGYKTESNVWDKVRIYVDEKNMTITNYTMEGHLLDPGKVKRFVVEECDNVKVITIGSGLNYCSEEGQIPNVISNSARDWFIKNFGQKYGEIAANGLLSAAQKYVFKKFAKDFAKQNGNGNFVEGTILFKNVDIHLKQSFNAQQ